MLPIKELRNARICGRNGQGEHPKSTLQLTTKRWRYHPQREKDRTWTWKLELDIQQKEKSNTKGAKKGRKFGWNHTDLL